MIETFFALADLQPAGVRVAIYLLAVAFAAIALGCFLAITHYAVEDGIGPIRYFRIVRTRIYIRRDVQEQERILAELQQRRRLNLVVRAGSAR